MFVLTSVVVTRPGVFVFMSIRIHFSVYSYLNTFEIVAFVFVEMESINIQIHVKHSSQAW